MFIEVAVDGGLQIDDGAEDPSSQALAGQSGEEIFDGVEPGAGGRGEMEGPARMADEPGLDLGVLVGCVIVDNGVDQLASRDPSPPRFIGQSTWISRTGSSPKR